MTVAVPHLALPFRLDAFNAAPVLGQDSLDEVAQCVAVLLSTEIGSRMALPTYGVADLTFQQSIDTAAITRAVAAWEPRARISVAAGPGPVAHVAVNVAVGGNAPTAHVGISVLPTTQAAQVPLSPPPPTGVIYDGGSSASNNTQLLDGQPSGTVIDSGGA